MFLQPFFEFCLINIRGDNCGCRTRHISTIKKYHDKIHFEQKYNAYIFALRRGGLAHLVERKHGMFEVTGSIPVSSTLKGEN